jgi:hypothetical protein
MHLRSQGVQQLFWTRSVNTSELLDFSIKGSPQPASKGD